MNILSVLKKATRALARAEARAEKLNNQLRASARADQEEQIQLRDNHALLQGTLAQIKALRATEVATSALLSEVQERREKRRHLDSLLAAEAAKELKKLL